MFFSSAGSREVQSAVEGPRARKNLLGCTVALVVGLMTVPSQLLAQEAEEEEAEGPNHLSLVVAGTHIGEADETALTLGVDYEYRASEAIGLGAVVEHAFGELDSTTVLAVADIHLWKGLALQVGPGVEFADDDEVLVGRIGAVYEFEVGGGYALAPQVHFDFSEEEDAIVFGVSIGRAF